MFPEAFGASQTWESLNSLATIGVCDSAWVSSENVAWICCSCFVWCVQCCASDVQEEDPCQHLQWHFWSQLSVTKHVFVNQGCFEWAHWYFINYEVVTECWEESCFADYFLGTENASSWSRASICNKPTTTHTHRKWVLNNEVEENELMHSGVRLQ